MYLLVSGATTTVKRYASSPHLGHLLTPRKTNSVNLLKETGLWWAADNDCFNGFNETEFVKMLGKIKGKPKCLFVNCPDVVGNAEETLRLFNQWEPIIREYNLPVALVAQDGIESLDIPWSRFGALFIGGTTEWKLGQAVRGLVKEAKRRGKWVHMGRVNSFRRLKYAEWIGCDSVDGSGFSRFPDTQIPWALSALEGGQQILEGFI